MSDVPTMLNLRLEKGKTVNLERIGSAVSLGHFEVQSPEWMALRRSGITGSDVASIVGVSKWTSAFALWAKKTGNIPDESVQSEAMYWGSTLESLIRDEFVKRTGWQVTEVGTYRHVDREWQVANCDGIIDFGDGKLGIFEAKTASFEDDWDVPKADEIGAASGVPVYYRTQVQHYLSVFGLDMAYLAVLFSGNKFRIFQIPADPFEQDANIAACIAFKELVDEGRKPDFDGSMATYEAVRAMHPDIDPTLPAVELGDLGMHLRLQADKVEAETTLLNELKSRTLDALGKAQHGIYEFDDGKIVKVASRQSRNGGTPYLVVNRK